MILSKRARTTPIPVLEQIVLKFIELAVSQGSGKLAKDALLQYRNITQNISVATIEVVIKRFLELAEDKLSLAQAEAQKINLVLVDDLEVAQTPETLIMTFDDSKERTDREVVTPWLRFLWEAYRTSLDTIKNNVRLEILYRHVVNKAFDFCIKYQRKTEFRRLCEMLRQHLTTTTKYANQPHAIDLNDPDTLQRHLDTRFVQLSAAANLEHWQEGFRSVEDIYNLIELSQKMPKPFMMANYYKTLSKIFFVGENYLFHAAAYNSYYQTMLQNKNLSSEDSSK
jgi:translation initiation factor 3 subunit A